MVIREPAPREGSSAFDARERDRDLAGHRLVSTRWARVDRAQGRRRELRFADIADLVRNPEHAGTTKRELPLWNLAAFARGRRRKACFQFATGALLDVDASEPIALETVAARLAAYHVLIHTTPSHRPDAARLRVIVPFRSRIESPDVFASAVAHLGRLLGIPMDDVSRRVSQPYYEPAFMDGYEFLVHLGAGFFDHPSEPPMTRPAAPAVPRAVVNVRRPPSSGAPLGTPKPRHLTDAEIVLAVEHVLAIPDLDDDLRATLGCFMLIALEQWKGIRAAYPTGPFALNAARWASCAGRHARQAAQLRDITALWVQGHYQTRVEHGDDAHAATYSCLFDFDDEAPRRRRWWQRRAGDRSGPPQGLKEARRAWRSAVEHATHPPTLARVPQESGITTHAAQIADHSMGAAVEGGGDGASPGLSSVRGPWYEKRRLLKDYRTGLIAGGYWSPSTRFPAWAIQDAAYVGALARQSRASEAAEELLTQHRGSVSWSLPIEPEGPLLPATMPGAARRRG